MADVLYFRGSVIGDVLINRRCADRLLTPPVYRVGLMQANAAVESASRNLLAVWIFTIVIKRSTETDSAIVMSNIRALQGLTGLVELKTNGSVKLRLTDFTMEEIPDVQPRDGFGGRLIEGVTITFTGNPLKVQSF